MTRILRDRNEQYGDPRDVHERVAALWSARTGVHIPVSTVLMMLVDLKTARAANAKPGQDTLDDVVGYAMLYADEAGADD